MKITQSKNNIIGKLHNIEFILNEMIKLSSFSMGLFHLYGLTEIMARIDWSLITWFSVKRGDSFIHDFNGDLNQPLLQF